VINEMDLTVGMDPCPTMDWTRSVSAVSMKASLEKLFSFACSLGYSMEIAGTQMSYVEGKKITLKYSDVKTTYYSLLHELGHVMIMKQLNLKADNTVFSLFYSGYLRPAKKKTKVDEVKLSVTLVHEELDAWRKGLDVAAMLELPLNLSEYSEHACMSVGTYIYNAAATWSELYGDRYEGSVSE